MVKNTMLNVVFPINYQLQFPNLRQAKNSHIINIQYMFSHQMKDKYVLSTVSVFQRIESNNSIFKFLVRLHGEYNILVKLCGNTT